jgi:hypothetical protein
MIRVMRSAAAALVRSTAYAYQRAACRCEADDGPKSREFRDLQCVFSVPSVVNLAQQY